MTQKNAKVCWSLAVIDFQGLNMLEVVEVSLFYVGHI
jgi:hypothetical protein